MESETISFRCRGELKDWLESYADDRMVTVSMAAQEIIAEKYREERAAVTSAETGKEERYGLLAEKGPGTGDEVTDSVEVTESPQLEGATESEGETTESEDDDLPPIFEKHRDRWYTPDTEEGHRFAVRLPEDAGTDRKYYKTVKRAAQRLRDEYGDE